MIIAPCPTCGQIGELHEIDCSSSTIISLRAHIAQLSQEAEHSRRKWAMCAEVVTLWQGKCAMLKAENRKLRANIRKIQKAAK